MNDRLNDRGGILLYEKCHLKNTKYMDSAKVFAKAIHQFLIPIEEDVYKLEDVALFLKRRKSAFLYLLYNLVFLLIWWLRLPFYTIVFLCLGLYFSAPFYFPLIKPILRRLILGKKVKDLAPDAPRKRYSIQQISAFVGTLYYLIDCQLERAKEGILQKKVFLMAGSLFVLNFIFYLFLSISDTIAMFVLLNGILLLPFLLQQHISSHFQVIQNNLAQITSNFAIEKVEEEKTKVD